MTAATFAHEPEEQVGTAPEDVSPLVKKVLEDPLHDEATRRRLAIFHGKWDGLDKLDLSIAEQAEWALARYDLRHPSLESDEAPLLVRAEAALMRGEPEQTAILLEKDDGVRAALLRGLALEQLGRTADAHAALLPWRERMEKEEFTDPADLVAGARILVLLAELEGRPALDYQLALSLFTRAHDQLDRLYWPAVVAEAQLLADKDNRPEAVGAAKQALSLNLKAGSAWHLIGKVAANGFNFDEAALCAQKLREINEHHPLAAAVEAEMALVQKDPAAARAALGPALEAFPTHRELLALRCATEAMSHDETKMTEALARFDALSPGNPEALYTAGRFLALARQYEASESLLRQAIERQPNWPPPRVELGLMLMQAGKEDAARKELQAAVDLDPFNRRAANQLKLVEHLAEYAELRTEHFVIKFKPGIDQVLAQDMAAQLESTYEEVTGVFGHRPRNLTLIEIMPDEKWFGVRITGLPEIWTIAAATGDVIALTPPREGVKQRGSFDWARVIRHEFVHTVTLDQTRNRIAHWFTEACAVSQEPGERDYPTAQLLAAALHHDKLFDLKDINWAFVRPKSPQDRPLAYAQAHWMHQYITARFGHRAILKMLELYGSGVGDPAAVEQATGQSASEFMAGFGGWATEQVKHWGLAPASGDDPVKALLSKADGGTAIADDEVAALLKQFPDHPELLRYAAERAVEADDAPLAMALVSRYAAARPVDPWADEKLVVLSLSLGQPQAAMASLEQLDRQESQTGAWAAQLAKLYRAADQFDGAAAAIRRALHREPYNATYRELAGAIDLQRNDLEGALVHLRAMTLLEPARAVHLVRLAALYDKIGRNDDAKAAAEAARKLDASAPVEKWLGD